MSERINQLIEKLDSKQQYHWTVSEGEKFTTITCTVYVGAAKIEHRIQCEGPVYSKELMRILAMMKDTVRGKL